jgi:hypothetical protein
VERWKTVRADLPGLSWVTWFTARLAVLTAVLRKDRQYRLRICSRASRGTVELLRFRQQNPFICTPSAP